MQLVPRQAEPMGIDFDREIRMVRRGAGSDALEDQTVKRPEARTIPLGQPSAQASFILLTLENTEAEGGLELGHLPVRADSVDFLLPEAPATAHPSHATAHP